MGNFFAELRRRHIYRIGAGYVIVAWGITQVLDVLSQLFALPDWIAQPAVIVLAVGFPFTLIIAWLIEGKAHEAVASAVRSKTTTVDWLLIGAVAALIALTGYQQFVPSAPQQAGLDAAISAANDPDTAVSIAVLPFANMSGDPEQEFFSDGMTEEITSALARIPDLSVVGRTSAFQYKDRNEDLRTIGEELNATHLIEGSVRRDGDRIRVTAQLIESDVGTHLWVENYDRQVTDIFEVQEEIATAIADALGMQIGLTPRTSLVVNRIDDSAAYENYLRARALYRQRGDQLLDAAALLETVVASNPDFAPAWALLGLVGGVSPIYEQAWKERDVEQARPIVQAHLARAEVAAQNAIELEPTSADGYIALGVVQEAQGNFLVADDLLTRGLALDPTNPEGLHFYSVMLADLGYLNQALPIRRRLLALDPFVPPFSTVTARVLWANGDTEGAIALFANEADLALLYVDQGRNDEAIAVLQSTDFDLRFAAGNPETAVIAVQMLSSGQVDLPLLQELPPLGAFGMLYVYFDAPDRVMDYYEEGLEIGIVGLVSSTRLWQLPAASVRQTERFKSHVRSSGHLAYWRERGWPDLCRPIGPDNDNDFECD
jgi:TolB-like protein/tetratricopeptide (TPR) repeat protein